MRNLRKSHEHGSRKKALVIAAADILSICTAFFAALWLRFDFQFNAIEKEFLLTYARIILPWCAICLVTFYCFRLYNSIWSFVSTDELMHVLESYAVLAVVAFVLTQLLHIHMPKSFYVMGLTLSGLFPLTIRFAWRLLRYIKLHLPGAGHGSNR